MIKCRDCKHEYNGERPRCPACGTSTPRRSRPISVPKNPYCDVCDGPNAPRECGDCGAHVHAKCQARHDEQHARELTEMMDLYEDMARQGF